VESSAEVTAAEIARIAGVGRAAVSNWRKRFADFPAPVGGSPSSPSFSLSDVEAWLRRYDRLSGATTLAGLWLAVQHAGAAQPIEQLVPLVARHLINPRVPKLPAALKQATAAAAADVGAAEVFSFLLERYFELQGRGGVDATPAPLGALMARLVKIDGAVVLDPALRSGELLWAAAAGGAKRLLGQAPVEDLVTMADVRLTLAGADHVLRVGGLGDDAFPDLQADVVLCNPPFAQRDWGYDELTYDARWEYELPPRSESELAWVQHALARLRPAGEAVLLLPPGVASRTSGRRVRKALLRRGALRAVVALPPGAGAPAHLPLQIWLLRRPTQPASPHDLLMIDAADRDWPGTADEIAQAVAAYQDSGELPDRYAHLGRAVPLIDLIDDDVDLTPARHVAPERHLVNPEAIRDQRARLVALTAALPGLLPPLPQDDAAAPPTRTVSLADLIRDGQVGLHTPSETTLQRGDVLIQTAATHPRFVVVDDPATTVAPEGPCALLRPRPDKIDPWFLGGFIARAANVRLISSLGSSRLDVRRARLPHLSLNHQRDYGTWFERLDVYGRAAREVSSLSTDVIRAMAEGLASGPPPRQPLNAVAKPRVGKNADA
jgi:type I restriction-modification system DNA methylase subunit